MADHYDLIIAGGTLIDPAQGVHDRRDVGFAGGKVAEVAESLAGAETAERIDAEGLLVVPGLIDLHVHVFDGVGPWGIDPDRYCLARGTTTVLDAGSAGGLTMDGFRRLVIERARTRVRTLVHISGLGLVNGGPRCAGSGELEALGFVNVDWAVAACERHREHCHGIKVRLSAMLAADGRNEREALRRAREAADRTESLLMVHTPQSSLSAEEILEALGPGDIWTHCLHGHAAGIVDGKRRVLPAVRAARERGIVFDVGHGAGSFSWDVAQAALEQNLAPDVISSDIHAFNIDGPVWDMPTVMTKLLHLGMTLDEVIAGSTAAPAAALGMAGQIGTLAPGAAADATLLALEEGQWELPDSLGQIRAVERRLRLRGVVNDGRPRTIAEAVGMAG